jgi:hypothetical protein
MAPFGIRPLLPGRSLCLEYGVIFGEALSNVGAHILANTTEVKLSSIDIGADCDDGDHQQIHGRLHDDIDGRIGLAAELEQFITQGQCTLSVVGTRPENPYGLRP